MTPPLTIGAPVDVLVRQALSLAELSKALRAQLDAVDRQVDCLLETIRLLQPPAPTPRAATLPPVFGRPAAPDPAASDPSAPAEAGPKALPEPPMTRDEVLAHA